MTDSYYYQSNGQIVGPLTPAALKQLANDGVIVESTLVRRGEQGAWCLAGTFAGLITPKAQAAAAKPGTHAAYVARETFRKAEEQAEKVASTLWFLDLKFTRFFTPKLIGVVWAVYLCLVAMLFLFSSFGCLLTMNPFHALVTIFVQFVALIFAVVSGRVVLESILVIFRIAESLEAMKRPEPPADSGK
jgi:hypothetical protein